VSKTLEQMVEDLSSLSVIDLAKLKKLLEEKWGVTASAPAAVFAAPAAGAGAPAAAAAESTEFQVTLEKTTDDTKKIGVIKVVRDITGLGLKEAKDMVDNAPKVLKPSCNAEEAKNIIKKISEAGGQATMKGL
jgi:large subunit ribosomal protein L7/L12